MVKHADGYLSSTISGLFTVSADIYDAKPYKRLGDALRQLKSCKAEKVIEVSEENRREWRGDYELNEEEEQ